MSDKKIELALAGGLASGLEALVNSALQKRVTEGQIQDFIKDEIQKLPPYQIKLMDGRPENDKVVDGYARPELARALLLAHNGVNTLMVGPAGCGKTYIAKQEKMANRFSSEFTKVRELELRVYEPPWGREAPEPVVIRKIMHDDGVSGCIVYCMSDGSTRVERYPNYASGRRILMLDYTQLPAHCQDAMRLYVEERIPPGGFITSVLANDFAGAVGKADAINSHRLRDYAMFLHNEMPARGTPGFELWGSYEIVNAWING